MTGSSWVGLALGLLLQAASALLPASAAELLIGVTPSALSLPMDVAAEQGFFAAEGLAVRLVDCQSGPRCMQLLFDSRVQLTCVTELPVVFSSFQRADHAIVGSFASASGNIRLIGRRSTGVTDASQLPGKRVGVLLGTSSHYLLDTYLLFNGIDPQAIRLVPLQPEGVEAALADKEVDAVAGYLRHLLPLQRRLGDDAVVLKDLHLYTETYNLVGLRPFLTRQQGDVVKVLRAVQRAQRFIAEQPQQARAALQRRTRFEPAEVERVFPGFTYRLSLNQSLVSTMEAQARWAVREHRTDATLIPNYATFVDDAPLRQVAPALFSR